MAGKDATNGRRQPAWFIDFEEDGSEDAARPSREAVRPSGSPGSEAALRADAAGAERKGGLSPGMVDLLLRADAEPRKPRFPAGEPVPGMRNPGAGLASRPSPADEALNLEKLNRDAVPAGAAADLGGSKARAEERAGTVVDGSPAESARHPRKSRPLPLAVMAIALIAGGALTLGKVEGPTIRPEEVDTTARRPDDPGTRAAREAETRESASLPVTTVAVLPPPSELILPVGAGEATASVDGEPPEAVTQVPPRETVYPVASGPAAPAVPAPALTSPVGEPTIQAATDGPVGQGQIPRDPSATLAAPRATPNDDPSAGNSRKHRDAARSDARSHARSETVVEGEGRSRLRARSRGSQRPTFDKHVRAVVVAEPRPSRPSVTRRTSIRAARTTDPRPATPRVAQAERIPVLSLPTVLRPTPF